MSIRQTLKQRVSNAECGLVSETVAIFVNSQLESTQSTTGEPIGMLRKMAVISVNFEGLQSIEQTPMSTLDLIFDGKVFPVPKKSIFRMLEHHESLQAKSYAVQSSVPNLVFEGFVDSLKTPKKIPVTKENAVFLSLLAKEFFLPGLASECSAFSVSVDQFWTLSERVSELERHISDFEELIESHEEGLEGLRFELERLKSALEPLQPRAIPSPSEKPSRSPSSALKPQKWKTKTEIPMKEDKSLDGIISYLTNKHGGNVHEKRIVTITSKSVYQDDPRYAPKNVADLTSDSKFWSKNDPGQWISWDFRAMRVCLTHYAIRASSQKSWVVESSVDGESWTEIDRQPDDQDFKDGWSTASFAVSNLAECRFIRLTQTNKRHSGGDQLPLSAVEFFGTLCE
jgi:hypothetical protein